MDESNKDILQQIEDAKKMVSEMNDKKKELNDVFDKLDFTGFEGMRKAIDNINLGDEKSMMKAHKIMGEEMKKMFKKQNDS